jgi:3-oxoacyl-[acyl-carrier-protein] synthase-3
VTRASVVTGVGSFLPARIVTNDDFERRLDTSDEWIRSRTGIGSRHHVDPGLATSHLAVEAGRRALTSAGVDHVDAVVLATTTPDRPCPATAPQVAAELGLQGIPAFDIAAVCSGFLYGLAVADGFIRSGFAARVMVIGAETFSTIVDQTDRNTAVIFGDGAGAMVLQSGSSSDPGVIEGISLGSDGDLADLITVRAGGSLTAGASEQPPAADHYFSMQGRSVFTHSVIRMTAVTREVMKDVGWEPQDVDHLVGHQANLRILHAIAQQLDLPLDRLVVHLDRVGNTAAASVPLALVDAHDRGLLREGDRIVLSAFGGGATWGAAALRWPALPPAS